MLHTELRNLLTGLYGARFASAFSWHSIRIGLACALHAADCPDAVIQLICRWACPDSLKVYRQMGIEKNIFWTERAQRANFDAARVNNIPALDNNARMLRHADAFASPGLPTAARQPEQRSNAPSTARASVYTVPGGTVHASADDGNGLVGLTVGIYNNFWPGYENSGGRTRCPVIARCIREFLHPDGERCLTYLVQYDDTYWPIKYRALWSCVAAAVRVTLPEQRS